MVRSRVGVAGLGGMGTAHVNSVLKHPEVAELVAGCDPSEKARARFTELVPGARVFEDYGEFLAEGLDAVIIASPTNLHADQTVRAHQAGCHVLSEKPMAGNLEDALRMKAAAEASGKRLSIGFNHRFAPSIIKASELLPSFGTPMFARVMCGHGMENRIASSWFGNKELSAGGTMLDNAIHFIDLVTHWFGPVKDVTAFCGRQYVTEGDVDDTAFITVRHRNGVLSSIGASWIWWDDYRYEVEVVGQKGLFTVKGSDRLEVYMRETRDMTIPNVRLPDGMPDGCELNDLRFLEAIRDGTEPPVPAEAGIESLKVALASYESQETGRTVTLPE